MLVRRGQCWAEECAVTNWVEGLLLSIPAVSRRATKACSPYTRLTGELGKLAVCQQTPSVSELQQTSPVMEEKEQSG
jgi:hypothetical protein